MKCLIIKLMTPLLLILIGADYQMFGQTQELHAKFEAGDCTQGVVKRMNIPVGTVSIKLHILHYSQTNKAGYPLWMGYNRYEPQNNGWSG